MPGKEGPAPVGKKTKKEKRRERKAAAAAEEEASGKKRPREDVEADKKRPRVEADDVASNKNQAITEGRRLFVGHLPQRATEEEVREFFGGCGALHEVEMLRRMGTRRFKGQAFVTFLTADAARLAMKLSGSAWRAASADRSASAKCISVERAMAAGTSSKEEGGTPPKAAAADALSGLSCFVGNMPETSKEWQVREAFKEVCGEAKIRKVKLLPAVGGERRCFVDFNSDEAAQLAVAQNGKCLAPLSSERPIIVAYSRRPVAPRGDGRRSHEAKIRRREKREETRPEASSSYWRAAGAGKPGGGALKSDRPRGQVLVLGS